MERFLKNVIIMPRKNTAFYSVKQKLYHSLVIIYDCLQRNLGINATIILASALLYLRKGIDIPEEIRYVKCCQMSFSLTEDGIDVKPYFTEQTRPSTDNVHLVVCVHGLDGMIVSIYLLFIYCQVHDDSTMIFAGTIHSYRKYFKLTP